MAGVLAELDPEDTAKFSFLWVETAPESGDYHGRPVQRDEKRLIYLVLRGPSQKSVTEFHLRGRENGGRYSGVPEDCGKGYFAG